MIKNKILQSAVALSFAICAAIQCQRALGVPREQPLPSYCGTGVCPPELANYLLPLPAKNVDQALGSALSAVKSNPGSADRWMDLAEISCLQREPAAAKYAGKRAQVLAPHSAIIKLRAAQLCP